MKNIMLIAESKNYLTLTIQEKFEELGFRVIVTDLVRASLVDYKDVITAMLLYLEDRFFENKRVLLNVEKKAMEEDVPVFAVGSPDDLAALTSIVSSDLICRSYERPIDVKRLALDVEQYIKSSNNKDKKRILVIDDSGAMLRAIKTWFEGKYHVILANSGAMAIKYLSLNRPDLILLDYDMPVLSGKQILEMIRAQDEYYNIPVFFLTTRSDKEAVMSVKELKPEGYLLKTLQPAQIIRMVDEFFGKRK